MSIELRREYLEILRSRYEGANRKSRSQIIDELVLNTGLHRKSAIRRLREGMRPKRAGWGRKKVFSSECIVWLRRIWKASDQQCSKKLKQMMKVWISKLSAKITQAVCLELQRMSAASIDRYLKPFRALELRRAHSGTRPGSRLFRQVIPLKTLSNIPECAGHIEADTVAHSGGNMASDFIWSLTITDSFTGWTENRAVWGKHANGVHEAIENIEKNLPFKIKSINVDNGSEFLNHRLVEYFSQGNKTPQGGVRQRFRMTRSRSYHKNDNPHVEQKNWTHVRQIFGYERFEFKELLPLMNEIYKIQNLFSNFWIPQFKLKNKVRVGAKIKKTYHTPSTPYQRLLDDPTVSEESKVNLRAIYETLNPFDLREKREALLASFFKLKRDLQREKERIESRASDSSLSSNTYN